MAKGAPLVRFTLPIKVALEYIDFAKTNPDHRISGVEFLEGLARQRVRLLREAVLYYLGALAFAYVSLSMGDDNSILVSISPISFEAPISRALLVAGATYAFMIFCARLGSSVIAQTIIYVAAMPRNIFSRDNVSPEEIEETELNEVYIADIDASHLFISALRPRREIFASNLMHKLAFFTFMAAATISSILQFLLIVTALVSFADAQDRFSLWHLFGLLCIVQVSIAALLAMSLFWTFGFGQKPTSASQS